MSEPRVSGTLNVLAGRLIIAGAYRRSPGISSRMDGQEAGRSFRCTAHAADRLLRVILYLRGGDVFRGKSNLASSARKQRSCLY